MNTDVLPGSDQSPVNKTKLALRLERASQCFGLTTPATSIADLAAQVAALDEDAQKHEDAVLPGTPSLEEARRYLVSQRGLIRLQLGQDHRADPPVFQDPQPHQPVLLPPSLVGIDLTPEALNVWNEHCKANQNSVSHADQRESLGFDRLTPLIDRLSPAVYEFLANCVVLSAPHIDRTSSAILALFSGPYRQTVLVAEQVVLPESELIFLFHHLYCHTVGGDIRKDICDARIEYPSGDAPAEHICSPEFLEQESAADLRAVRLMAPELTNHLSDSWSPSAQPVSSRQLWLRDLLRYSRAIIDQIRDGLSWSREFRGAAAVVRCHSNRHVYLTLEGVCEGCGEPCHIKRWIPSTEVLACLHLSALDIAEIPDDALDSFQPGVVLLSPTEINEARAALATSMHRRPPYPKLFTNPTIEWNRPPKKAADRLPAVLMRSDQPLPLTESIFGTCFFRS